MPGPMRLPFLQARLPDTSKLPTSRLQVEMLVTIYLTAALAYVTYGLRMYSRIASKQAGLADWLMTAATVVSVAFMFAQYLYLKYNYAGFTQSELPTETYTMGSAGFSTWLVQLLYSPILGLVKSSTLVLMLKIAGHMKNIKWSIHVINTINICLTISTVIVTIFATIPISAYWDDSIRVQHNIDHASFIMSTSFLTILTDILVLAIPVWAFIRTQLPLATRLGVIMIFMTGGLVTAIGMVRFCVLADQYWEPPGGRFMNTWGPSYSAIETNLAITTACLPALGPLLRTWLPHLFGGATNSGSGGGSGGGWSGPGLQHRRDHHHGEGTTGGREGPVRMRDLGPKRLDDRCGSGSTAAGGHEGVVSPAGIRRTTDIHISYSSPMAESSEETGRKGTPRPPDPALMV